MTSRIILEGDDLDLHDQLDNSAAFWAASRIAPRAQISDASADESTSWCLPSVKWTEIDDQEADQRAGFAVSRMPFSTEGYIPSARCRP
jgi:hypothetical protein